MELDATFRVQYAHRLRCTAGVPDRQSPLADLAAAPEGSRARCVLVVDEGLARAQSELLREAAYYFDAHHDRLVAPPCVLPGGETAARSRDADRALELISEAHLCRRSYVIVAGGGALLDAVGLAASLAHRGVRLIRIATTTLSQSDSALGVKTASTRSTRKTTWGVRCAVGGDPRRGHARHAGRRGLGRRISEAVKVALLKDPPLTPSSEARARSTRGTKRRRSRFCALRRSTILNTLRGTETPLNAARRARSISGTGRRTNSNS